MAKISFTVGAKHEPSDLILTTGNPLNKYPHLKHGFSADDSAANDNVKVASSKTYKAPVPVPTSAESPALQSEVSTSRAATTLDTPLDRSEHPRSDFTLPKKHSLDMAEPPAKRAKRTDSAAMWERTSKPADTRDKPRDPPGDTTQKEGRDRRDDKGRKHGREERTRRSRSRSRERRRDRDGERRKDRSRSEERKGGRLANGHHSPPRERDGKRRRGGEREDRDRSVSRERHRSRRDEPPSRRPDRRRSRSRSPARDPKSTIRTRSPPRGPSSKPPPSGPSKQSRTSPSPPPTKAPPKGPKSNNNPLPKTNGTTSTAPSNGKVAPVPPSKMDIDEDSDPETAQMRRMMGFADFKTTKNTKVPGNDVYAVRKEKKTEYRQYMNRVGGFNRPLSPSR
ncbi:MAG: hypothetical protein L6R42_003645 [Xanthoria sp. 1 TBL-2021]|nr:MAG: hypothetical protein L6R42_003645 [Xanthoria sp. 1 TBL-2021]